LKKRWFIILFTLVLAACNPIKTTSMPEQMPEDFDFSLQYGIGKKMKLILLKRKLLSI